MKKLYEKNEIWFAVLWIIVYCAATIPIRGDLGDESPLMLLALAVNWLLPRERLLRWLKREDRE